MSFQVGDMTVRIDHQANGQNDNIKKQKTKNDEQKPTKSRAKSAKTTKASPLAPAKAPTAKSSRSSAAPPQASGIGNHTRPKQTARRGKPFNPSTIQRDAPQISIDSNDDEPPPSYSPCQYDDDDDEEAAPTSNTQSAVQISGEYTIDSPSLHDSGKLLLRLSNPRNQLWGTFTIGTKIGVIRLDRIDNIARPVSTPFGWRSEDCEMGQLKFGKGCDGWLQFDGQGGVEGTFHGLMAGRDIEFQGRLGKDFGYEDDDERDEIVERLTAEWHEYPERAYGRG